MTPEERWIGAHVEPAGPLELVHDEPWSTVLRVPVADGSVWFKHCKAEWAFEARLTEALARRWPDRLPEVVAHDAPRAWLLTRDVGTRIDDDAVWPELMRLYAELQRGEVRHAAEHVAAGVRDLRLAVLPERYAALLERRLPVTVPERSRLERFTPRFAELCGELASRGVPETIQHDDLHQYNVFVRDGRPRILDWGDSSVAHPYFSLVATLRHVEDEATQAALTRAFLDAWDGDADTLDLALRVGRIAHAFASPEVLENDDDWPRVVGLAVAQTDE